jgi:DNA topoisomerase-3
VAREGKNLVATEMGIGLIDALPVKSLGSPELTGTWEARLSRVARGQETRAAFMGDISRYVSEVVSAIRGGAGVVKTTATAPRPAAPPPSAPAPKAAKTPKAPKPPKAEKGPAEPLTCPRCKQGQLVAGNRGWGCSRWREGCGFVIWFQVGGQRISDAELGTLIAKGKTRKRKWPGANGEQIEGRLVLDLEASREAGAARLET